MGRVKGCINEECVAHKSKIHYKESEEYCSKCGTKLAYVCKTKNCYTFLEQNDGKYCIRCQAKNDDRYDRKKEIMKTVVGVGSGIAALGVVVLKQGKAIIKNIPKLK